MFELPKTPLHPDVRVTPPPTPEEVQQHVYDMMTFYGINREQITKIEVTPDGFANVWFTPRQPIEFIYIDTVINKDGVNVTQRQEDPTGS